MFATPLGLGLGQLGPLELLIIFIIVLVLFGAKRIPEIARGLGKGIREFKSATSEISRELTIEQRQQRVFQPPVQQPTHASAPQPQAHTAPQGTKMAVPPAGTPPAPQGPVDQP